MNETRHKELFCRYLKERGVESKRIKEKETKSPDLLLENGSDLILCEFKAPELHLDESLRLYKWKTTHQKLHSHYRYAVKQFKSEDPNGKSPRLLAVTSTEMQLNLHTMREVMQGHSQYGGGILLTDFRRTDAFGRWLHSFGEIDAIIWLQLNSDTEEFYQAGYFTHQASSHFEAIHSLFRKLISRPVGEADEWIVMSHGLVYGSTFRAAPNCSFQQRPWQLGVESSCD